MMDEINKIRKAFFLGKSKNAIAKKFRRSWDTIDRMVSMNREELQVRGKRPGRKSTILTPKVLEAINRYLDEEIEKRVRRKQKYTATKIFKDLKADGIYKGSERRMQEAVRRLRVERDQSKTKTFLPLSFALGEVLQIDHGEVDLFVNNRRLRGYLFVAAVPGYVLRYYQIFPIKSQEAWGEFHERAFRFFGGPFAAVMYDNDSVLVKKVLGSERKQTDFSLSLEEHYGFESRFCNLASGNEKGAVENGVGYGQRNFMPGCPSFSDWEEANKYLLKYCQQEISDNKHYKSDQPLSDIFNQLKLTLKILPPEKSWHKWVDRRVDTCQLVSIDDSDYSIPEKYVGATVQIALTIFQVRIFKDGELIAAHDRKFDKEGSLRLEHYLDQLQYKAGAFWDCKAVQNHKFDDRFLDLWEALTEKFPKKEANREFVQILLLGRRYSQQKLLKAVEEALKWRAINHASIETILRSFDAEQRNFSEEALNKALSAIEIQSWEFNIAQYATLCEEVAQ